MRWDEHGIQVPTTAFDAARLHHGIKVTCRCLHFAVHDPHGLWWACECRGWSDRFQDLAGRFYCLACLNKHRRRVRHATLSVTREAATITLPMPDEREWKRALKRVRT